MGKTLTLVSPRGIAARRLREVVEERQVRTLLVRGGREIGYEG